MRITPGPVPIGSHELAIQHRLAAFALRPALVGQRKMSALTALGDQQQRIRHRPVDQLEPTRLSLAAAM